MLFLYTPSKEVKESEEKKEVALAIIKLLFLYYTRFKKIKKLEEEKKASLVIIQLLFLYYIRLKKIKKLEDMKKVTLVTEVVQALTFGMKLLPIREDFIFVKHDVDLKRFYEDPYLQEAVFLKAQKLFENMQSVAKVISNIAFVEVITQLKADTQHDMMRAIKKKSIRKQYSQLGQITDLARGRINCMFPEDVPIIADTLTHVGVTMGFKVRRIDPRRPLPSNPKMFGYPRIHILFDDFEWQIGHKAVEYICEKPSVPIAEDITLSEGVKPNIHEIVYKYFSTIYLFAKNNPINKKDAIICKKIVDTVDIEGFLNKVDTTVAHVGYYGWSYPNIKEKASELQQEAGQMLSAIKEVVSEHRQHFPKKHLALNSK